MTTAKEELLAFNIRKQIAYLEALLKELESVPEQTSLSIQRVRQAESQLRELRIHLEN